jgi:hypothetical protein
MPITIDQIKNQLVREVLSVPHHDGETLLPGTGSAVEYAAFDALKVLAET